MQLFQSWKESLSIFKPENAKLFFLVTIKSIGQTYQAMIQVLWPVIIAILVIHVYKNLYPLPQSLWYADIIICLFFVFFMFLFVRSSVPKKSILYVVRHFLFFIPFLMLMIFFSLCEPLINWTLFTILFFPFWIFVMLFMLDSDGRPLSLLGSIRKALIMECYNFPAIVILYICTAIIRDILLLPCEVTLLCKWVPLGLLFFPISITIFTNFYIKFVHSQFSLYFGQKKVA